MDCVVNTWATYSSCSVSCGDGTQSQSRTVAVSPLGSGAVCLSLIEFRACNLQICPVDCVVSSWTYGTCSVTCGGGTQSKSRTITTRPVGTGTACLALTSSQTCNTEVSMYIGNYNLTDILITIV